MNPSSPGAARDGIIATTLTLDGAEQLGQGKFAVLLDSSALTNSARLATFAHSQHVNIAVGIHPAQDQVVVLMNMASGSSAKRRQVYNLPKIPNRNGECQLVVNFQAWRVLDVVLEGVSLPLVDETVE